MTSKQSPHHAGAPRSRLWFRDLLAKTALRSNAWRDDDSRWSCATTPIPALVIAGDLDAALHEDGYSTTAQAIHSDGALSMLAMSRADSHQIRIHALPFEARASAARRALRGVQMLSRPASGTHVETNDHHEHRILIATFRTNTGTRTRSSEEWVYEFFQRIPKTEPRRSRVWRQLSQAARVGTPLRCSYPLTAMTCPTSLMSHHVGALVWASASS